MMRQFIVHFGAHKTGTTAFQRFLQDNRDILTAAGLCIPRLPEGQDGNYQGLARVMAGEYNQYPNCLLYTSPSPRDATLSRMPSSA